MLREQLGDPNGSIDTGFIRSGSALLEVPSGMVFRFHTKKKDGTFSKNQTTASLVPTFCPFCGKPYRKDSEEAICP